MDLKFVVLVAVVILGFALNIVTMWLLNYRLARNLGFMKENADKVSVAAVAPTKELTAEENKIKKAAEFERQRRARYLNNLISYDGSPQNKAFPQGDSE